MWSEKPGHRVYATVCTFNVPFFLSSPAAFEKKKNQI